MPKSIILSSAGLKNLVFQESAIDSSNKFTFIIGTRKIQLHKHFAEFLSPKVSHLHQCDPTIDSISYDTFLSNLPKEFHKNINDLVPDPVISMIEQISSGYPIDIEEKYVFSIRFLSTFFGNSELLSIIDSIYPNYVKSMNINEKIKELQLLHLISDSFDYKTENQLIDEISSHFNEIDKKLLKTLPKSILYLIISNDHIKKDNEDSILDFIYGIFSDDEICENDIIDFYEKVDIGSLSVEKLREFLEKIDISFMSVNLWRKICEFFLSDQKSATIKKVAFDGKKTEITFDGNPSNRLKGIIQHLTDKFGGNVCEKRVVKVTGSSNEHQWNYAVDLNSDSIFQAKNEPNQWLKYDFKERRIRPTHYTIRTRNDHCDGGNPQNWVIEGSNTDNDDDWKILDSRQNVTSLQKANQIDTFDIGNQLQPNEFYRYIRLRQTGKSSQNLDYLTLTALEYFGTLVEQ